MNNFYKILFVISLFSFSASVNAQKISKEEKRTFKKARKDLANENYKNAQANYLKLLELNPTNDLYNFEAGLSYYFSDFERSKSIPLFETALKNSKEDTIPELKYYLGRAYHLNNQFEESKNTLAEFTPFIKQETNAGKALLKETNYRIKLNENGLKFNAEKNNTIKISNLGSSINSSDREYAPVFRKDDNVLLFTSRRKSGKGKNAHDLLPYEDIFVAKKVDDFNWRLLENNEEISKYLPEGYNTKKHDAGIIYSADGKTLYTYKKDILWQSTIKDNKWSKLEELTKDINNSQFNVPSISVTQDGNTMFFVSTKKDGIGGKDIYKSTKDANGNWSSPENLGPEINTDLDEDAPFLSLDEKTLYFSSKGHEGIGGYDIFKSEIIDNKPSTPVNMGLPLNSPLDDIYLVIDNNNEIGFFSSDREGGFGGMDIFGFDLSCPNIQNAEIRGIVYNTTDKLLLEAQLSLTNTKTNELTNETKSLATNGKFLLVAPPENTYKLKIEAAGFNTQSLNITLPKQCEYYPLFSEIALEKIEKDGKRYQIATIRNSFFNTTNEIENTLRKGVIDTSNIVKEVPFIQTNNDKDFENDKLLMALSRTIDTTNTSLNYSIISDTIEVNTPPINLTVSTYYQEFFGYNIKEVNTSHPDYIALINNAVVKAKSADKIYIDIESSASKVPTKTYKTNINLASIRGDEAKEKIINSLVAKGISRDRIEIGAINSIVSGPNYTGDFNNTEKYKDFQYIKITIK